MKLKLSKQQLESICDKILKSCFDVAVRYSDISIDYTEWCTIVKSQLEKGGTSN